MGADSEAGNDGDTAVDVGLGACSRATVAGGLSLTGGLGFRNDLGRMVVSLLMSEPRMSVTSDGMG